MSAIQTAAPRNKNEENHEGLLALAVSGLGVGAQPSGASSAPRSTSRLTAQRDWHPVDQNVAAVLCMPLCCAAFDCYDERARTP